MVGMQSNTFFKAMRGAENPKESGGVGAQKKGGKKNKDTTPGSRL